MWPWALAIGLPVILVLIFIGFKKKHDYKKGKKVAGAAFLVETPYYKKMVKKYKVLRVFLMVLLLFSMTFTVIMLARPVTVEKQNPEIHNRDIFLCLDISDSMDEVNLKICEQLMSLVKELQGERFGISIFNGKSVLLVPLTTDYEYVLSTLSKLNDAFDYSMHFDLYDYYNMNYDLYYYKYEGTLCDYGSSFIGDGLASCLYSFTDMDTNKDRSRMIIFATDNELNGVPIVSVPEAAALCAEHEVKVYSIVPRNIVDEDEFKTAILSTGGGYYTMGDKDPIGSMLKDIKKTRTSLMTETITVITDKPKLLFILLLISVTGLFYVNWRMKL